MKRIFYLIETLEVGGTEKQAVDAAVQLHSKGHQVTVGCLRAQGALLQKLRHSGIRVVEFPRGKKLFSLHGLRQVLRLARFLHRERFDVLHAHDLPSNVVGVAAGWLARTPIIISSRRYLADLDWSSKWKNTVSGMIYRLSTFVIVNSVTIREMLIKRHGMHADKLRVIHNAIDPSRFLESQRDRIGPLGKRNNSSRLVAVVANMHSQIKGHACLISAAEAICRECPQTTFVLVGDGQERSALEQQAHTADLERNFRFLGARNDVPEILASCDMFVLPSFSEGMPNAVLEAMAAGLAVVATSVGGVPEIIESELNGLLVPPNDPAALSEAILRLLRDNELRQRLAKAGRESVLGQFGYPKLVGNLESLYAPSSLRVQSTRQEIQASI